MKPLAQKPTKPIISTRNTPQTFTLNKLAKPIVRDDIFSLPPAVYGTIYLTLIPLFGFLYSTLPNMQFNHEDVGFLEAMYFSTITVTTTGFGDITPTNTFTRAFVMIEATIGVELGTFQVLENCCIK